MPYFLCPIQIVVILTENRLANLAKQIDAKLENNFIRSEIIFLKRNTTKDLTKAISLAKTKAVPYFIIINNKNEEHQNLNIVDINNKTEIAYEDFLVMHKEANLGISEIFFGKSNIESAFINNKFN